MGDCLNGKMLAVVHTATVVTPPATSVFSPATPIPAPAFPTVRTPGYSF